MGEGEAESSGVLLLALRGRRPYARWRPLQELRRAPSWQPARKWGSPETPRNWGSQPRNAKEFLDFFSNLNEQIPPSVSG